MLHLCITEWDAKEKLIAHLRAQYKAKMAKKIPVIPSKSLSLRYLLINNTFNSTNLLLKKKEKNMYRHVFRNLE